MANTLQSPTSKPTTALPIRGLFGDDYKPRSEVGHYLALCRATRATRAWLTPGCYAWWRYTDELKARQRWLVEFRKMRR